MTEEQYFEFLEQYLKMFELQLPPREKILINSESIKI